MSEARPVAARVVLEALKRQQLDWATRGGILSDSAGYCARLEENLFRPLSAATRIELAAGDGGELGRDGARGKAQALHSSATLACNFFDPWRERDLTPLARALHTGALRDLAFERKFPTGLRGTAPNLDVVLREASGRVHAIESKFTEPFCARRAAPGFRPAYFERGRLWADRGLPSCQRLAERLRTDGLGFDLLDVPQLLKHMLGLAKNERDWFLWLLWFDPGEEAGERMNHEIERFTAELGADAYRFRALTYQDLFDRLYRTLGDDESEWREYLRSRYFGRSNLERGNE